MIYSSGQWLDSNQELIASALFTDFPGSAEIPLGAIDLGEIIEQAQKQVLSLLPAGAIHPGQSHPGSAPEKTMGDISSST
jgi:hypothetical protein